MSDLVPVRCSCGQQMMADPKDLGQQSVCTACGTAFLLWPEENAAAASKAVWYVKAGEQVMGPFPASELRNFVAMGRIQRGTQVRKGEAGAWIAAATVRGLLDPAAPSVKKPPGRRSSARPPPAAPAAPPSPSRARGRSAQPARSARPGAGRRAPRRRGAGGEGLAAALARHPTYVLGVGVAALVVIVFVVGMIHHLAHPEHEDHGLSPALSAGAAEHGTGTGRKPSGGKQTSRAARKGAAPTGPLTTQQIAARSLVSVALVQGHNGTGTGFLIGTGLLCTNRHVIEGELMRQVRVQFPDAPKRQRGLYMVKLMYEDPTLDLAFLTVDVDIDPLDLAPKHAFARGQEITVIGSPGLDGGQVVANAISRGILSTKSEIEGTTYYQLDVAVNPGNSGGPVFDDRGRVIGVVTLKANYLEGVAFSLPLASVRASRTRAKAATSSDIAITRARHRLRVTAIAAIEAGYTYRSAMRIYVTAMKTALAEKKDMNVALLSVRFAVAGRLRAINGRLLLEVGKEASTVQGDPHLSAATRSRFQKLWANYNDLKSYVDAPRGNIDDYAAKCESLGTELDEIVAQIRRRDGIDFEASR